MNCGGPTQTFCAMGFTSCASANKEFITAFCTSSMEQSQQSFRTELRKNEWCHRRKSIARKIHELRTGASLTQTQLAKLIGTTASVICRLEDAGHEGHSLAMLRRIADALNQRVEIRFVPIRRSA